MFIEDYFKKSKKDFYDNGFVHFKLLLNKKNLSKILHESIKFKINNKINTSKFLHIHKHVISVRELFNNNFLKNTLKFILNYDKIKGLQSEFFYNPKGTKGYGYHQDDFFLMTGRNNSANLWIPLTKTNSKNGTLSFLIKSHLNKIDNKTNLENLKSEIDNQSLTKKFKIKKCNCQLGDAILISNHVFHRSSENKSNKPRTVLALGYIKANSKFNSGLTAKRKPFNI